MIGYFDPNTEVPKGLLPPLFMVCPSRPRSPTFTPALNVVAKHMESANSLEYLPKSKNWG